MLGLVIAAAVPPRLPAQEVTVGPPGWVSAGQPPDEMPRPKRALEPDYPPEMRKTGETGYVIIVRYVDSTGQSRHLTAQGTHLPFQRAVEAEFDDWKMAPARRGAGPVDALLWMPVIFNPQSATTDGPDRSPRLLAVAPVFLPAGSLPGDGTAAVPVHLQIDEAGAIGRAEPEKTVPDKLRAAIAEALKSWRFLPATRGGRPVAAEITLPVLLCQTPPATDAAKPSPPKLISQVEPVYPYAMLRFGLQGRVTVEFVIDTEGRTQNPIVVASDNPAFDRPAIEAVRQWKFQPATVGGRRVNTRSRQQMFFVPEGGGENIFRIGGRTDQSKLPAELRYDVPPKIRGVLIPVYPYAQRRDSVRGKVAATIVIDPRGQVAAVKVRSADHPELGLALTAALEGFAFDPALKDGRAVPHLLNFEQKFADSELPDDEANRLLSWEKKSPDKIVRADQLDAPLKPISRRPPLFPKSVPESVTAGEALIECLIDEEGWVHLPRIISASDPAFGYAAVQAAAGWWFDPPRKAGKPVVTRVRIPFDFRQTVPGAPADKAQ